MRPPRGRVGAAAVPRPLPKSRRRPLPSSTFRGSTCPASSKNSKPRGSPRASVRACTSPPPTHPPTHQPTPFPQPNHNRRRPKGGGHGVAGLDRGRACPLRREGRGRPCTVRRPLFPPTHLPTSLPPTSPPTFSIHDRYEAECAERDDIAEEESARRRKEREEIILEGRMREREERVEKVVKVRPTHPPTHPLTYPPNSPTYLPNTHKAPGQTRAHRGRNRGETPYPRGKSSPASRYGHRARRLS